MPFSFAKFNSFKSFKFSTEPDEKYYLSIQVRSLSGRFRRPFV